MGTTKRERQKANRQQRLEQLAKTARRDKTRRRSLQIGLVVGGGLLALFAAAYFIGDDDDDVISSVDTVNTLDTAVQTTVDPLAPTTTAAPTTTIDPTAPTTTAAPTTTVAEAFAYGTGACPPPDGSAGPPASYEAPELCIDPAKTYTAEVVTNKGSFTITLDPARSPGNVNNFVTLARHGYYDGTSCHRIIKEFVVQCGRSGDDDSAPGYSVPDELPGEGEYTEGMVVIANTGQPDSGGAQFFVITGENGVALPPSYSIIGTVTTGYSTVQVLENLADPLAENGTPPLVEVEITSVTITES